MLIRWLADMNQSLWRGLNLERESTREREKMRRSELESERGRDRARERNGVREKERDGDGFIFLNWSPKPGYGPNIPAGHHGYGMLLRLVDLAWRPSLSPQTRGK